MGRLLYRLEALEARLKTGPYMRPFRFHGEPTSLLAVRVMMFGSIIPWILASAYISIVCDPYSDTPEYEPWCRGYTTVFMVYMSNLWLPVSFSALVANFALSGFSRVHRIQFAEVPIETLHYLCILLIF